ncbi:MAG TPA: TonB family protein [Thermoanaerobaculia bacterium]|nr:TonB family protein [Thermoanaerobaculia bacterium]
MTDRKTCIRCQRAIDAYAKTCPYCNWDQSTPPPTGEEAAGPSYVPPRENLWRNKILGAVAFVALVIIAFVVGTFIHGFEPNEVKASQQKPDATATALTASVRPEPRSNVTLVPVTGDGGVAPIEQPITSAPPQAAGQQSTDATAMPESEYAAAAARAKAQEEADAKAKAAMVDPRSITGNAYDASQRAAAAPKPPAPDNAASSINSTEASRNAPEQPESAPMPARTAAILESRPLPHIATDHDITARLNLTVAPDGHVTDIDISEPIPNMADVISAVQRWHFKPATENGEPVTSRVSVDITFHANE